MIMNYILHFRVLLSFSLLSQRKETKEREFLVHVIYILN